MATTGEECYYQKPIYEYFDFNYDKMFDAQIEHKCTRFDKNVVPARQCGTVCQGFKPLVGILRTEQSKRDEGDVQADKSARIRKYIQQQLYSVCDKLRDTAQAIERRNAMREQRWREVDDWLNRAETKPEFVDREIAEAEQEMSAIKAMQARIQRDLRAEKGGHNGARDFTQLWLEMDKWAIKMKHARERKERAEATRAERSRIEQEHGNSLDHLEAAMDRISSLKRLRTEVARCVKEWLADTEKRLTEADSDRALRFLQSIARYATDDIPIADLKAKVDELSQRHSLL